MTQPAPLVGPKLKIERAKRHFRELESEIAAFRRNNPYRIAFENYVEGGENRVAAVVRDVKPIPPYFAAVIGDVIHNLRACLDLLATDLARANGHTSRTALTGTYFPTGADRKGFETEAAHKIERLSPAARRFIYRLQPYKGGHHSALRRLHDLDIDDKHSVLIAVGALLLNDDFSFWIEQPKDPTVTVYAEVTVHIGKYKCPLEEGDKILSFSLEKDTPYHVNIKPTFDISFGQGQIFDGKPVLPTLQSFIDLVERIVRIAERRFFT